MRTEFCSFNTGSAKHTVMKQGKVRTHHRVIGLHMFTVSKKGRRTTTY